MPVGKKAAGATVPNNVGKISSAGTKPVSAVTKEVFETARENLVIGVA
ncbi:MAG: hypothetical protein K2X77_27485 [Candidatus Obscuribacterales bacterium]|jgi:hypothetical protein|nr:hypothetical protein [Candidatus Obscuribacterales bacterium]